MPDAIGQVMCEVLKIDADACQHRSRSTCGTEPGARQNDQRQAMSLWNDVEMV